MGAIVEQLGLRRWVTARSRCVLIGSLALALIGATNVLTSPPLGAAGHDVSVPSSVPSQCGSGDSSEALSQFLATVPANTLVTFPENGCFVVNETVLVQGATGLTIDGNGSTFKQTASPANPAPLVELWNDKNLTIENLKIEGNYDGTNGGSGEEGDYGVEFEADSGVTLTNDSVSDIQGDFLYFSPPYDVTTSDALSTGITITNSTFTNAGYHGLTVESVGCPTLAPCNGLMISGDTFSNINVDAMDFEYDEYSTPFNPDGTPYWAAEDDVTISHNTWINWGNDWFASVQGQLPGVQEQNLTLSDNTLEAYSALFEVVGTNRALTPEASTNDHWTITGNTFASGYYGAPYRGSGSVSGQLYFITNLTLANNNFPLCDGEYEVPQPASECTAPSGYVFDLDTITYGSIANNDFSGSLGIVLPQPYNQYLTDVTECSNSYGANGGETDGSCSPATPPPPPPKPPPPRPPRVHWHRHHHGAGQNRPWLHQ